MNDVTNFYDELDLKYPEIGIAMQQIDRINPGKIKFNIPILTPNVDNSKMKDGVVRQDNRNLMNAEKGSVDIKNINVSNYIEIPVPSELCTLDSGTYTITSGYLNMHSGNIDISGISSGNTTIDGQISGTGSVSEYTGSINVNGRVSGVGITSSLSVSGSFNGDANVTGEITITPNDRYIPTGSKWIIVFIGGDITKPRVIGRYLED